MELALERRWRTRYRSSLILEFTSLQSFTLDFLLFMNEKKGTGWKCSGDK